MTERGHVPRTSITVSAAAVGTLLFAGASVLGTGTALAAPHDPIAPASVAATPSSTVSAPPAAVLAPPVERDPEDPFDDIYETESAGDAVADTDSGGGSTGSDRDGGSTSSTDGSGPVLPATGYSAGRTAGLGLWALLFGLGIVLATGRLPVRIADRLAGHGSRGV